MIHSLTDTVKLNNGTDIPGLGLGVFQIPDADTSEVVKNAIVNGYRSIDTAAIYGNETGTGLGIKQGLEETGISRDELFVTSKVWNNHLSYDETIAAFHESLTRLSLDYLDLYLIHWPGNEAFEESWKALEDLYAEGKIKAIGVSNFQVHHLEKLFTFAKVVPAINQIELHPKLAQLELRAFCEEKGIHIQAWSPLMQGQLLTNKTILALAEAHKKSPAQIILRWAIQQDILLNVKSTHSDRMRSNADIFDFQLSQEEMEKLNALNENLRVGPDPDSFDFK
ncbi:aldo/keto reductase [Enterococcus phoeniculicola]|jgi:diketogulonate reductase-like aldo/keto reductase|uniref:Aldo/keto reductase n=1 Tax=Enterococcus phoeniculicola ATCC BAA-412 TaxID=1158610 RepID=R3WN96_9ENTE|nr:aldo/keto reductase [Enterococcus phoeniculicola]EOL48902.1 aldo/keto reductase [Enterococcus phoeniculicola ATCC BAA-412]EOT72748.1 aldo/keto reductase [Enterococcus phoeniculicola ATCC BAA-412]OJG70795.1 aldo/keto reductase [Enterococcus phoeniculicola]